MPEKKQPTPPAKDTLYIDAEDDITAVIRKLRASKKKIVALVPPSRATVFTSAVNLKLLQRAAEKDGKKLVLVTKQATILALAGGLSMYVADKLNTPPHIPPSPDTGGFSAPSTIIQEAGIENPANQEALDEADELVAENEDVTDEIPSKKSALANKKKTQRIPNFSAFKKRIFLVFGGALGLVAIFVWAVYWAPSAEIIVRARTEEVPVTIKLDIKKDGKVDQNSETVQLAGLQRTTEKTISQPVTATGEKNIGQKASGTMTVVNCEQSTTVTFKQGTRFVANGLTYTADESFAVPGSNFSGGGTVCLQDGKASVSVTATDGGDNYNVSSRSYSIQNISGDFRASGSDMSGGTDEIVAVIVQADIDRAVSELNTDATAAIVGELRALFPDSTVVIAESLSQTVGSAKPNPVAGTQAKSGSVEVTATYGIYGVVDADLLPILSEEQNKLIDQARQEVTTSGIENAVFTIENQTDAVLSVVINATGSTGPVIGPDLTKRLAGLRFSEAEQIVSEIPGAVETEINTSPFWVYNMPKRADRIKISLEQPQ